MARYPTETPTNNSTLFEDKFMPINLAKFKDKIMHRQSIVDTKPHNSRKSEPVELVFNFMAIFILASIGAAAIVCLFAEAERQRSVPPLEGQRSTLQLPENG